VLHAPGHGPDQQAGHDVQDHGDAEKQEAQGCEGRKGAMSEVASVNWLAMALARLSAGPRSVAVICGALPMTMVNGHGLAEGAPHPQNDAPMMPGKRRRQDRQAHRLPAVLPKASADSRRESAPR